MATVVTMNKQTGMIHSFLGVIIALKDIQLGPGYILSWQHTYYSAGPGFNWISRVIHRGNAVAFVDVTRGAKVDHVDVRIEGDPQDVEVLVEEITLLVGGKVSGQDATPPNVTPSVWQRVVSWWRRNLATMQAETDQ